MGAKWITLAMSTLIWIHLKTHFSTFQCGIQTFENTIFKCICINVDVALGSTKDYNYNGRTLFYSPVSLEHTYCCNDTNWVITRY